MNVMPDFLKIVRDKQDEAKSYRKKGDAMRKVGKEDVALDSFRSGLAVLNKALELLRPYTGELYSMSNSLSNDQDLLLRELVETLGAQGGLFQRLGLQNEALAIYSEGAELEQDFELSSTYNRLNPIKSDLILGNQRLGKLKPKIEKLAKYIETRLRRDKSLSDSGWAWADFGDCMALLGNTEKAELAYKTFIAKAEIKSPERTLDVLKGMASDLERLKDPDVQRLLSAIDILQKGLTFS
jgi:tetratricopeptide (TPR) repeat protein